MSTTTGTVHHFTVEAITNPQWRGQWMTRCLCGWHTSSEGMSTRAIAPIVGASQSTIRDDVAGLSSSTQSERPAKVMSRDGVRR